MLECYKLVTTVVILEVRDLYVSLGKLDLQSDWIGRRPVL